MNYFTDQLEKRKKEEEEIEQLMEEVLKEVWGQRDQQRRAEREARNRLMEEVMETRSLQIQHKREEIEKKNHFAFYFMAEYDTKFRFHKAPEKYIIPK